MHDIVTRETEKAEKAEKTEKTEKKEKTDETARTAPQQATRVRGESYINGSSCRVVLQRLLACRLVRARRDVEAEVPQVVVHAHVHVELPIRMRVT